MKKSITSLFLMFACAFGAQAQANSYPFNEADLDANGWLWFDTPEKIEKYVGVSEDGKIDPNGKIFQMVSTESASDVKPPFNKTFASDTISGFGDPHNQGSDIRKGAIVLHKATQSGKYNDGGAVLINLPSCKTMSMVLSCQSSAHLYLSGTNDAAADTSAYSIVYQPSAAIFPPGFFNALFVCNIHLWEGLQTFNNEGATDFTLASAAPVYAMLQVAGLTPVYLHGVRITTEETTGIENATAEDIRFDGQKLSLDQTTNIKVYNSNGILVTSAVSNSIDMSNLAKGIYLVKAGNKTQKIAIR